VPNFSEWRSDLDRWGFRQFLHLHLMSKLRRWLVLSQVRLRFQEADASELGNSVAGCTVRLADRDDLVAAARDPQFGLVRAHVDAALARGDICAAANAALAAYSGDVVVLLDKQPWRPDASRWCWPHSAGPWMGITPAGSTI